LLHELSEGHAGERYMFVNNCRYVKKWCQNVCYILLWNHTIILAAMITHSTYEPQHQVMALHGLTWVLSRTLSLILTVHVSTQMTSSITASQKKRGSFLQHNAPWRCQFTKFINLFIICQRVCGMRLFHMNETALLFHLMLMAQTFQFAVHVVPIVFLELLIM